mmetsp:Transcript_117919/g.313712  ORF Transcript_117919/g.313712 Transcript_117919/m.313712 type:complete len:241 (+) Transcript_117919:324-1046(+)
MGLQQLLELRLEACVTEVLLQLLLQAQRAIARERHGHGVHVDLDADMLGVEIASWQRCLRGVVGGVGLMPALHPVETVLVVLVVIVEVVRVVGLPDERVDLLDVAGHLLVLGEALHSLQHVGDALHAGFESVLGQERGLHLQHELLVPLPELHRALAERLFALAKAVLERVRSERVQELELQPDQALLGEGHLDIVHVELDVDLLLRVRDVHVLVVLGLLRHRLGGCCPVDLRRPPAYQV